MPSCYSTTDMFVEEYIAKCCDLQRTVFLKHGPEKNSALISAGKHSRYSALMRIPSHYSNITKYICHIRKLWDFKCSNLTDS